MKKVFLVIGLLISVHSFSQENNFTTNPDDVTFYNQDITNFWNIFDKTNIKFKGKVLQKEYLDKGSIGLRAFIPYRIESGNKLARTIRKNLAYYQSIRKNSLEIESRKEEFYISFRKLKNIYPKAIFPDVYFVIGRKNTGGTIFNNGLVIGAERFGEPNQEFKPDINSKYLDDVVAHELIHFQQNYVKDNSLLAQSIREGAGDFLGEMIAGSHTNKETYAYGEKHRVELWKEFSLLKDGANWDNWLYRSKDKSRPDDLGYWMGYKICESYYKQSENKMQAIHDILNIDNFNLFLEKSGFKGFDDEPIKLEIKVNKNIELLGLGYFIGFEGVDIEKKTVEINGKTIPKKEWHKYGFKIYQEYKTFATSNNLTKCFSVADHLWLDYLTAFLLQVDDVPNAHLKSSINKKYYLNFSKEKNLDEAKANAEIFLNGLNDFSKEIVFDTYLFKSKEFYDKAIEEIENNLPEENFVNAMELFYNKNFDKYLLVPSLTIPKGMGFGINNTEMNETKIFNVFGALDFQEFEEKDNPKMGFANQEKLRELSVHEFGHSFVNPIIAKLPDTIFTKTEHLFEPLKSAMSDQGYNTWKVCIYEHFVRAGEIIITEKIGENKNAEKLLTDYLEKRKFRYIFEITTELRKYDKGEYKSYYEMVEKTMKLLTKF